MTIYGCQRQIFWIINCFNRTCHVSIKMFFRTPVAAVALALLLLGESSLLPSGHRVLNCAVVWQIARPGRDRWDSLYPWRSWWRHQMETFSASLVLCAGNSPVTGEFPSQRPVTRSFDVFFDLRLNKQLSKHRDAGDLRQNCAHYDVTVMCERNFSCDFQTNLRDWRPSCSWPQMKAILNLTDDKPALVQVMAWCHQAASHYLSQCWPAPDQCRHATSLGHSELKTKVMPLKEIYDRQQAITCANVDPYLCRFMASLTPMC